MTDSLLKLPTRTEAEARRDRARKTLMEAARKECLSESALREAMSSLESAFDINDLRKAIGR